MTEKFSFQHAQNLRVYAGLIKNELDISNRIEFADMVMNAVLYYGIDRKVFGDALFVTPSTICKWASGLNVPHQNARQKIADFIRDQLLKMANELDPLMGKD